MSENKIHLNCGYAELIEENIIEAVIGEYYTVEPEDLKELADACQALAQNNAYAALYRSEPYATISKEARESARAKGNNPQLIATAIVSTTLSKKLLANFFINVDQPIIKTRHFEDRSKAIEWLRSELTEEK